MKQLGNFLLLLGCPQRAYARKELGWSRLSSTLSTSVSCLLVT